MLAEAVGTVHRAVSPGLERDLVIFAAVCADDRVHLSGRPIKSSAHSTALVIHGPSISSAIRAALGIVGISLFRMVLLVVSAEHEFL